MHKPIIAHTNRIVKRSYSRAAVKITRAESGVSGQEEQMPEGGIQREDVCRGQAPEHKGKPYGGLKRIWTRVLSMRVLSRAVWSSLEASRILLMLLVNSFVPKGPVVMGNA